MSRPKREWYPGATYHVMSRGNRRLVLYKDVDDYLSFIESIHKARELYPFRLHSLCLMTNHFHMAIETKDKELWKIMSRILHPYAMNFNRKYHYSGHLFENRYTSCLIEDERYFLEVSRYIHLNPVKAHMVRAPLEYEYSSYGLFVNVMDDMGGDSQTQYEEIIKVQENTATSVHKGKKFHDFIKDLVQTDRVLSAFRNNPREQYRMFVEGKISHAEQELLIQKDMKEDDMWLPW